MQPPRAWPVLVVYLAAFVVIISFSVVAVDVVRALYPDLGEQDLLGSLPGLLAGGAASSLGLAATLLIACRPFDPARIRLTPGRETGATLGVVVVGTLALGQVLDSLTVLAGLQDRGSMATVRRALEGSAGLELFAAVVVIGVMAGAAEEAFFRGYMQTELSRRFSPRVAVLLASLAFALMHVEAVHAALAFALGLWLGFVTERLGSALPAMVAHVVNNALFTLLTATVGAAVGAGANAALGGAAALVFAGAVAWLARR